MMDLATATKRRKSARRSFKIQREVVVEMMKVFVHVRCVRSIGLIHCLISEDHVNSRVLNCGCHALGIAVLYRGVMSVSSVGVGGQRCFMGHKWLSNS